MEAALNQRGLSTFAIRLHEGNNSETRIRQNHKLRAPKTLRAPPLYCTGPTMPSNRDETESNLSDAEVVERVLRGDTELYQQIITRYNRRLYRVIWVIVQDKDEAEDIVQETYVRAYEHLDQFAGRALFSTWLTKIAIHEAWGRMKHRHKQCGLHPADASLQKSSHMTHTPEDDVITHEERAVLEEAINALPEPQRAVLVMRSLEQMSVAEVANCLDITEQAVKMRFLRARRTLRRALDARGTVARPHTPRSELFEFLGERCARVTANIMRRIAATVTPGRAGN
jgi:RNA polymerase sigma-70 factor (ECF subfamily)